MKESLLSKVIALEWEMFSAVSNEGGKASCQLDPATFAVMRRSQAGDWPVALLRSWIGDLEAAKQDGRNLMSEKYAWMMQSTAPDEFARLAHLLPAIDGETLETVEAIVEANVRWKEESAARYPALNGRGRPLRTASDTAWATSFETYLRGELKTCSPATLRLLRQLTLERQEGGVNGVEATLLRQVRLQGYDSLEAAEKSVEATSPRWVSGLLQ